jgi:hypothetical protein
LARLPPASGPASGPGAVQANAPTAVCGGCPRWGISRRRRCSD